MISSSRANTSTSQTTNNRNLNLQDTSGVAIGEAGGSVTIISSDANAIGTAEEIARSSLDVVDRNSSRALDLAEVTSSGAFDLADAQGKRAYDFSGAALEETGNFARNIYEGALGLVGNVVKQGQETIGTTVTGLNTIARAQSTSSDERIAGIANKALLAGVAVVGLVVLALMFKR